MILDVQVQPNVRRSWKRFALSITYGQADPVARGGGLKNFRGGHPSHMPAEARGSVDSLPQRGRREEAVEALHGTGTDPEDSLLACRRQRFYGEC